MRKKKKAPANTGLLAGARTEKRVVSCPDYTARLGTRQGQIAQLLGHGMAEAVPLRQLCSLTGWDSRAVRREIQAERNKGIQILSDNCHGYYLPGDDLEVEACVRGLRRRAGEIMRTARAIERGKQMDG